MEYLTKFVLSTARLATLAVHSNLPSAKASDDLGDYEDYDLILPPTQSIFDQIILYAFTTFITVVAVIVVSKQLGFAARQDNVHNLAELRKESLNGERPNDHRGPDTTTSETDQEDDEEHTKPSKPSPFFETVPQAGRVA